MTSIRRLGSAAAAGAMLVAMVPGAAQASETQRGDTAGFGGGYAVVKATVRFPSKKAFDIRGWVKDVCGGEDGDGRGAYARIYAKPRHGREYRALLRRDIDGCGNGERRFNPAQVKFDSRLRAVTVSICEKDADDPDGRQCALVGFHNWRLD